MHLFGTCRGVASATNICLANTARKEKILPSKWMCTEAFANVCNVLRSKSIYIEALFNCGFPLQNFTIDTRDPLHNSKSSSGSVSKSVSASLMVIVSCGSGGGVNKSSRWPLLGINQAAGMETTKIKQTCPPKSSQGSGSQ